MQDTTVIFVNSIDVDPDRQQELVDLLTEAAEAVIRRRPGFLSLSVLAGADGASVVSCARWRSIEDVVATRSDPAAAEYAQRVAAVGRATQRVYRVVADVR